MSPPPKVKTSKFRSSSGVVNKAQRIGIYGPGGIGKTSLVSNASKAGYTPCVLDIEDGSHKIDCSRISGIETFDDCIEALNEQSLWNRYDLIAIDSITRIQDMCGDAIMKQHNASSLEMAAGGYGKGYRMLYERMLGLFDLLREHVKQGRNVCIIAHDIPTKAPNPEGEDFLQHQPNLYASDKNSLRNRFKEELDHLLFIGYDVAVNNGKGKGSGTRTIYTYERPTHWAKSRSINMELPYYEGDFEIWNYLLGDQK